MAKGRKVENEAEARRCLRAVKKSGRPLREWARDEGIDARSLNLWRVIVGRKDVASTTRRKTRRPGKPAAGMAKGLVELVPASPVAAATSGATAPARYVLEVEGARLEFGDDASTATLRRVLEVLRSC